MKYIVETQKTIDDACKDLEESVALNNFSVLHIYDLKQKLNSKGVDFENACRIFEVCNPVKAGEVMSFDMDLNMALPCRISVWEESGKRYVVDPEKPLFNGCVAIDLPG